jgi:hypothetical protein
MQSADALDGSHVLITPVAPGIPAAQSRSWTRRHESYRTTKAISAAEGRAGHRQQAELQSKAGTVQFDPLWTILRLGHVADGAIVPTANDGRNRFGKFSAPVGSKSRKRTFLRMTPSFHWTATDLCGDRFADPVPVEGGTLVKLRHMTVSVVS